MIYKNKHGLFVRVGTLDEYIVKEQSQYFKLFDLKMTDRFLDIGANIGATAAFTADKVHKVFCYEPDVDNFKLLTINTDKLNNIYRFNLALVGNDDATRKLYLNIQKNKATHSFLVKRGRDKVTVSCRNINYAIKLHKINVIKMDVEGAEYELLTSMNYSSISKIDELIFEYHFTILKYDKYFELIKLMKKRFSYVKYTLDPKKSWTRLVYCSNRRQ